MTDETAAVRMPDGEWHNMPVCGRAPKVNGQKIIIVRDAAFQCYAARLTPGGYVVVFDPVRLYGEMKVRA